MLVGVLWAVLGLGVVLWVIGCIVAYWRAHGPKRKRK